MSNIVIIGSGPAGVSAALYTARAGVDTTVLTRGPGALDRKKKHPPRYQRENHFWFSLGTQKRTKPYYNSD